MYEAFLEVTVNATLAWAQLPGHPIVIVLRAKGEVPPSGMQTMTYIEAKTDLPQKCHSCWSMSNQNILLLPNSEASSNKARDRSLLYIPVVGYMDSVTYLRSDLQLLPPTCFSAGQGGPNTTGCRSERLERLMQTINDPNISYPAAYLCGSGVTKQTKNEIYLTSVVDELWDESLAEPDLHSYLGRLLLATPYGVFRTRAPPGTPPITLPRLYQPIFDPWFLRAMSSTGWGTLILTPPTRPLFDSADRGAVLTASVRVRHGYIPLNNTEEAISAVAAIVGAEFQYSKIHNFLYGANRLRGVSAGSNFSCGGNIRCYLIDQYAAVLAHPEFIGGGNSSNQPIRADYAHAEAEENAVFFGSVEPILMQHLVDLQFMLPSSAQDVTFTASAYWGLLRTWTADSNRVPLQSSMVGGIGSVLVDWWSGFCICNTPLMLLMRRWSVPG